MKNKNLLLIAGIGAAIYFLFCKKGNSTNTGTGTPTTTNNTQLMRQFQKKEIVNAGRKRQADVNGVII